MTESFPGAILVFITLIGAMVWIAWMGWMRSRFEGPSEVSGTDQAQLAQGARAFFVDPQHKLCDPATPSEFDTHLLSLLDSIEANRDDIDAKLENLRAYLKTCDMWQRLKYKTPTSLRCGHLSHSEWPWSSPARRARFCWNARGGELEWRRSTPHRPKQPERGQYQ